MKPHRILLLLIVAACLLVAHARADDSSSGAPGAWFHVETILGMVLTYLGTNYHRNKTSTARTAGDLDKLGVATPDNPNPKG